MIEVAVAGVGGWGKNLARNYFQIPDCSLKYVCDLDPNKLDAMRRLLPGTRTTTRFEDLLEDPDLNAIVIATPASTHYALCKAALRAGKDVYVEKPFVLFAIQAQELTKDVTARGQSYLQPGIEDVVFLSLNFNQRSMAHIHVSWLDPHKIRKLTIVGSKKMVVFDDLESTEKLRIYDKSAQHATDYNTFAEYITLRFGDITIPHVKVDEPLQLECQHFLDCVRERRQPLTDGRNGLRVVKVLEAAQRSLEKNGAPVPIAATF